MSILFYTNGYHDTETRMVKVINERLPMENIEIYRKLESFLQRCRKPRGDLILQIIAAMDKESLMNLVKVREQLIDLPLILIYPDTADDTIHAGYKLYPRYTTTIMNDFSDVALVLKKMVDRAFNNKYMNVFYIGNN